MTLHTQPSLLATPSDLDEAGRETVAAGLRRLVADLFALYVKTKNYHWHMSGRHFRDYHLLLDEQSQQILAAIDPVAERGRALGFATLRSVGEIAQLQRIADDDTPSVRAHDMLTTLAADNQVLAQGMRELHARCDEANDVATASILENYIDEAERRTWFLFETTREID
ncbi:Dps family protein [Hymenobacter cellulosivorans]|uniref:DNA starvation/stationary phase protection protein n=1 Tax=Hymenobacter cellulosivorans TaxID=2932249 RepID=A0ABY4F823_9BACT|nr:DNA starvation/stationary phase protection protein [Hymenobacter cellulosivorans]UOQ52257.1 DNA starvation/stationary phase protection protein [Hymenobacter cellulosivorans]